MDKKNSTPVKIVNELSGTRTDHEFSINEDYMPQMAGKIFILNKTPDEIKRCPSHRIYNDDAGQSFIFHRDDLKILSGEEIPLPDPEQFNPDKLFI